MRSIKIIAAVAAVALSGCSGTSTSAYSSGPPKTVVTVLAASSLTDAFTRIAHDVEARDPSLTIRLSFGPSSTLAAQVADGAPADVLATASSASLAKVTDAHPELTPVTFATNRLEIAVPAGNPGHIQGLVDFGKPELRIAVCAATVPCGALAQKVLTSAGVVARPDTVEPDVKAVLTKVSLGEVDAGLVYHSDVVASGDAVKGIAIPGFNPSTDYPILPLRSTAGASAFITAVRSAAGQAVLRAAGFEAPVG
jgi:molybdate transport system substrate-binding protein